MAGKASFADIRTRCEQHDCIPQLRTETRDGRVYVSLAAIRVTGKAAYDIRSDYAWDEFPQAAEMLDLALVEWWS